MHSRAGSMDLERLSQECQDWAVSHGLCMVLDSSQSSIPRDLFEQARSLATDFNLLVEKVSRDPAWLISVHQGVIAGDDFTAALLRLLIKVTEEGPLQSWSLGLLRSDYMLHDNESGDLSIQQVELNTIASSLACVSSITSDLHKHVVTRFGPTVAGRDLSGTLPVNDSRMQLSKGLFIAHSQYRPTLPEACILFVVQPGERNVFDQRLLEYSLWEQYRVKVIRRSLAEVRERAHIAEVCRSLQIDGQEISVVYFRAGYTPNDYPTEKEWEARALIESSRAIKCPNVAYHLAGTKKVQQELARPGVLERFVPAEVASRLRSCFAGLWSLETNDPDGQAAVERALAAPDLFVMKPQREGGGNNIYGEKVAHALRTMSAEERAAHILMARIRPPAHNGLLLRNGRLHETPCVSELGIYGIIVADGQSIVVNEPAGHLLRTKFSTADEGGVVAGFSVLDSPILPLRVDGKGRTAV